METRESDEARFDELVERASYLAQQDTELLNALVKQRQKSGLTQADVEERLGWAPGRASEFEVYYSDPSLSEIRRYALAVSAEVTHSVVILPEIEVPSERP